MRKVNAIRRYLESMPGPFPQRRTGEMGTGEVMAAYRVMIAALAAEGIEVSRALIHRVRHEPVPAEPEVKPNKSEAIRRILEADPDATAKAIRDNLEAEGITVSLDLIRVVRMHRRRKLRREEERRQKEAERWQAVAEANRKLGPAPWDYPPSPTLTYAPPAPPPPNPKHVVVKVDEIARELLQAAWKSCLEIAAHVPQLNKYMPTQSEAEQVVYDFLAKLPAYAGSGILDLAYARADAAGGLDPDTTAGRARHAKAILDAAARNSDVRDYHHDDYDEDGAEP